MYESKYLEFKEDFEGLKSEITFRDLSSAFDYTKDVFSSKNKFRAENWNDPILEPLREILLDVTLRGEYKNGYTTKEIKGVSICHVWDNDYNYFLISNAIFGKVIYVGYYKSRGRTESLYFLSDKKKLRAYDLLEVYDKLGILDS